MSELNDDKWANRRKRRQPVNDSYSRLSFPKRTGVKVPVGTLRDRGTRICAANRDRVSAQPWSETINSDEMATTTWAGTKGFAIITLLGTPFEVHSWSLAALT